MQRLKNILVIATVLSLTLACGNIWASENGTNAGGFSSNEPDVVTSQEPSKKPDPEVLTSTKTPSAPKKPAKHPHTNNHHEAKKTNPKN